MPSGGVFAKLDPLREGGRALREFEIRDALRRRLSDLFPPSTTKIVEEMGLCLHDARIDFAAINGALHGFEIKSDQDTLERLARQVEVYSRVMDFVTIVTGPRYAPKVVERIPSWWGIETVTGSETGVSFCTIREASRNPSPNPYAVAQLLWKDEAVGFLSALGLARGFRGKPRWVLFERISENVPLDILGEAVRSILRARESWRSDLPRKKRPEKS